MANNTQEYQTDPIAAGTIARLTSQVAGLSRDAAQAQTINELIVRQAQEQGVILAKYVEKYGELEEAETGSDDEAEDPAPVE